MKRKIISLYILLLMAFGYAAAQETVTVTANNHDISDNLDLQAVASIFGDSRDLEDFENRLNNPYTQISNLDLNRDGYVDYLRVVELSEIHTHLIVIQAVIGHDLYQDVATIEIERDRYGVTTVQVVGDVYMYGPNYIVEPVYVHRPLIVVWFWGPYYRTWYSPYYWGYYPGYYKPWHPYHPHVYRSHVYVHINVHHTYHYTNVRKSGSAINMHHRVHRNDYGNRHPENSFIKRNRGITNRSGLNQHRKSAATNSYQQQRPERNYDSGDYKSREAATARYDRNVANKNQTYTAKTKSSQYKKRSSKAKAAPKTKSKTATQKREQVSTRPQKQQKSVAGANTGNSKKADANSGYQHKSGKQYAAKAKSNSKKTVKKSSTVSSKKDKDKVKTQGQIKQTKKSSTMKSRTERR